MVVCECSLERVGFGLVEVKERVVGINEDRVVLCQHGVWVIATGSQWSQPARPRRRCTTRETPSPVCRTPGRNRQRPRMSDRCPTGSWPVDCSQDPDRPHRDHHRHRRSQQMRQRGSLPSPRHRRTRKTGSTARHRQMAQKTRVLLIPEGQVQTNGCGSEGTTRRQS